MLARVVYVDVLKDDYRKHTKVAKEVAVCSLTKPFNQFYENGVGMEQWTLIWDFYVFVQCWWAL
jgi:hypothetical protein